MSLLTASYVHGASPVQLIGETVGVYFDKIASRLPDKEAVVFPSQGIRWTYADLKREADAFASGLIAMGLEPGDRIGICSPNNAQWVVTQYATAKAGLILVNINPAYALVELDYVLKKVGCKALITAPVFKKSNYIEMLNTLIPDLKHCSPWTLHADNYPDLRIIIRLGDEKTPGMYNFADIPLMASETDRQKLDHLQEVLQFDQPINIQFTSGTTGFPKAAILTHHNILNNGFFIGESMRLTEHDRLCIPVPLYHCFGMVLGNLACLTHGSTMVYPGEAFDPLAVLKTVEAEQCTGLHGVPTMFIAELEHPEFSTFNLKSLRTGIMAGSPCPIEVMRKVVDQMHMTEITIAYGMTETSPVSFQSSVDTPLEKRVSTVGTIQPHIEAKVIDSDGRIVPPGIPGELLTRGYSVMLGYWNDPERTKESIDNAGWMHTGDLATIDEEGYCNILGRIDDMIIRGGENVHPREVEEFLYRHPKIQEVQVIGVPDHKYGEELCAWINLRKNETATPEEIREFCKGKIAYYKIPRHIKFVNDFPKTANGKIQKFIMREQMMKELGVSKPKTA